MKTTLENLPSVVKENRERNLALNIVKYQNFSTNAIMQKIDNAGYSDITLKMYINTCIAYIKTGKKSDRIAQNLYSYIDEYIAKKIQPLTPSKTEARGSFYSRMHPVQKVLDKIQRHSIVIDNTKEEVEIKHIAVQMGNNIRICNSKDEAKAFLDGLSFMGKTDAKIVKLYIREEDE